MLVTIALTGMNCKEPYPQAHDLNLAPSVIARSDMSVTYPEIITRRKGIRSKGNLPRCAEFAHEKPSVSFRPQCQLLS
eukprot:1035732-Amphidinium_carterae.1